MAKDNNEYKEKRSVNDEFEVETSGQNSAPLFERLKVGITHGDYNGVGYEVILKMLEDNRILELFTPVIYGSGKLMQFYMRGLELPQIQYNQINDASAARPDAVNVVNVIGQDVPVRPGEASLEAGQAALAALERAVDDLKAGKIDVLVTAPINKNTIQSEKFNFPGHTEYLEMQAADGSHALMIMANENLRVALVTTHLPLAEVAAHITQENIVDKLRVFEHSLQQDFGIVKPRIAVLALNPHAGDGGLLGKEEQEIIIPAIERAKDEKMHVFGPYAADGFFGSGLYDRFDGVLAMYHDQGLIPFKTLAMDNGVNFTAGLPFVRTSPDHGTGYDIAGKNLASEDSMRQAVYMAIDTYRNRLNYRQITANPLPKLFENRGKDNVVLDLK